MDESVEIPVESGEVVDNSSTFEVLNSSYIKYNGDVYERLETESENIELLFDDSLDELTVKAMKEGGFLSKGEFIRHALREIIKDKGLLEQFKNGKGVAVTMPVIEETVPEESTKD
jgi:hypothetical protein